MKKVLFTLIMLVPILSWAQEQDDVIRPQIMGHTLDCDTTVFFATLRDKGFIQTGPFSYKGDFWKLKDCDMVVFGSSEGLSSVTISSDDVSILSDLAKSLNNKYPSISPQLVEEPSKSNVGSFQYIWEFPMELISLECVCGDWFQLKYCGEDMAKIILESIATKKEKEKSDL